jgi:hypothetical protein
MGWSTAAMAKRCQHATDVTLRDIAKADRWPPPGGRMRPWHLMTLVMQAV